MKIQFFDTGKSQSTESGAFLHFLGYKKNSTNFSSWIKN